MQTVKEIIEAFHRGEKVQFRTSPDSAWIYLTRNGSVEPSWLFDKYEYRIAPTRSFLREYRSADEFLTDLRKHGPMLKYTKEEKYDIYMMPLAIREEYIDLTSVITPQETTNRSYSYHTLLNYFKWQDDSLCGVIENVDDEEIK